MPEYLDSEIPMVRRRASKDPKVYRYNYHPTVISKYICKQGSHYAVQNFIGQDGIAKSFGMMDVPSALKADDPFDMEAYGVPYSMNSRKRWKIMDELKRDISSFQDPSTGLRVTAVSLPATGCIETHVDRGSRGWLSEYHTVDEQHRVIDRKTKRTTFQSIIKPENPPRRRKGRLIRPLVQTAVETPIPREEQDRVNIWERPAHIVYQEQYFYEPTRKRNTRGKSEAYWTKIDPQQWRSMRFRTGYKCRFDPQITQLSDFTPSHPGCMDAEQFEEDVHFMDDYASEIDEWPGKNALVTLGEFRKRTREIDKDKCYSIPKDGHLQVEEEFSDSGFETTEMTVGDDLEPLDSFVTELKKNKTFDDLIRAINSHRVERIQPTSYLIDSIHHQPYRLLNKFLKKSVPIDFHGFIVLRPYCFFEYNSTRREYLRCILNDGEMENCLVLPHKTFNQTTKGEKSLIDFLPSESVVRCQSYAELDAQQFAYDELVAQMVGFMYSASMNRNRILAV
ncbi:unnamed protein product [Anisakis simplex]|uniref:Dynein heavy chain 1, axonemal n=1 Tax=Anisakis simplex TaxID=6269 RepID=A0A0M3JZD9_ANISI|nr:unnamed protein product [Anisakis simplex]